MTAISNSKQPLLYVADTPKGFSMVITVASATTEGTF
jgi:hypothetical protein